MVVPESCAQCGLLVLDLDLRKEGTSFDENRLNYGDVLAKLVDLPMCVNLEPW